MSVERSFATENSPLQGSNAIESLSQGPREAIVGSSPGGALTGNVVPISVAAAQPSTSRGSPDELEGGGRGPFPRGVNPPRPHRRVNLTGEHYRGFPEASKRGTHPVVRYPIPGGPLCYTFEHLRTTSKGQVVYRCIGCKKEGRTTSVAVANGCELIGDPASLPHVCQPLRNAQDKVQRIVYQERQEVPADPRLAHVKPRQLWQKLAEKIHYCQDADRNEREEMLHHFCRDGYESRRSTMSRAIAKLHDRRVSMEVVPREYAELPDGTPFLQYRTQDLHIYYSPRIVEKACQLGLCALVGDGVHDLQPSATNQTGQLYIIHGVMPNSVDFRLLYAICTRKTERVYDVIYGKLKDAIREAGGSERLRILLDYEKAAITAAKRNLWNKWNVKELRTTNVAEAFNSLLAGLMNGSKYPRMSDLLDALRGDVTTSLGALINNEVESPDSKRLKKKDIIRRRRIRRAMRQFKEYVIRNRAFLHTSDITLYCRRMSRFVTEKTI